MLPYWCSVIKRHAHVIPLLKKLHWRKRERQTDRQTDRHRHKDRERERERQTDRQTDRERESLKWYIRSSFFSVKAKLKCSHGRSFVNIYVVANKIKSYLNRRSCIWTSHQLHEVRWSSERITRVNSQLLNYKHYSIFTCTFHSLTTNQLFSKSSFFTIC